MTTPPDAPGPEPSPEPSHEPGHHHGLRHGAALDPDWRVRLRASGHRLTPQRELILEAVDELGHATPDQVFAFARTRSQAINLSTVYRSLEVLESLDLVRHAHLSDRAPTYHSVRDREHFHLVCRTCGRVVSVAPDKVAAFEQVLRAELGFVMDVGHLTVFGECEECP